MGVTVAVVVAETGIVELVIHHQFFFAVASYYTLSIAITSMANPWDGWYQWFFRFSHGMCAVVQTECKTHPVRSTSIEVTEVNGGSRR